MVYYYWSLVMPSLIIAIPVLLLLFFIWKRTVREHEQSLVWKTAGYVLLTPFRLILNGMHLPLGLLLAWLFYRNAKQNKSYKRRVIFIGFVVYLIGFLPLQSVVQDWFYPRDSMSTYLTNERNGNERGFSFVFRNPQGTVYWSFHEHQEEGWQLYEAIKQSPSAKVNSYSQQGDEWRLQLHQDTESYRNSYRRLEFLIRPDNDQFWLIDQGQYYAFRASHELVKFITPLMKAQSVQ